MKINGKKLPRQWLAALVAYGLALPTAGIFGNEQGFTGNRAAGYGTDRSNRRNHTRIERSAGK